MSNPSVIEAAMESSSDGLDPSILLPSQFFVGAARGVSLRPEHRLMLAVLEEAVTTFQRHAAAKTVVGMRLFAQVQAWIGSDDAEWPFSFLNICDALGLEPAYLRSGLRRWRDRLQAAPASPTIVIRSPFRHITGSRTRATALRRSA